MNEYRRAAGEWRLGFEIPPVSPIGGSHRSRIMQSMYNSDQVASHRPCLYTLCLLKLSYFLNLLLISIVSMLSY